MSQDPQNVIGSADTLALVASPLIAHRSPIGAAQIKSLVDAAADAGFKGLSIWTSHHDWAVDDGMTSEEYFAYHRERGLDVISADVLTEWGNADLKAITSANSHILDVSARAGARYVIAIMLPGGVPSMADAASGLGHLCDLAAERGLAVSFEFLPFTAVPTIASAVEFLNAVDRDNLGLVIDAWHWFRQPGGPDIATLRTIPPERIHIVQLNDAPQTPAEDIVMETFTARLLPGEGDIDLLALLDALADMGAAPAVMAEVFSMSLAELGAAEFARLQYDASRAVLEQHWTSAARR